MDPVIARQLAISTVIPGLLAGIILLAAWFKRTQPAGNAPTTLTPADTRGEPLWLIPLLLAGSYIAVHQAYLGGVRFPPASSSQWMPYIAALAALMGLTARSVRLPVIARWILRAVLVAACGAAIATSKFRAGWPPADAALSLGSFTALTLIAWWALERTADRSRGPAGPLVAFIFTFGASQLLVLGYKAMSFAHGTSVLVAVLGAATAISFIRPRFTLAFGGVHVAVLVSAAGIYFNVLYAMGVAHPIGFALALAASPVLALAADATPLKGWKHTALRALLALVPVAIALGIAAPAYFAAAQEPMY